MPEHFGLWATGCIARLHTDRMRQLGDAWLNEMHRWTIQDQVSLPYLFWRDGIAPGTFGINQLENDMVFWIAHAQELRNYRQTVHNLESRAILAAGRADYFEVMLHRQRDDHERLLRRKSVKVALGVAALTKPFFRLLRGCKG
jgi:hypothetical protein